MDCRILCTAVAALAAALAGPAFADEARTVLSDGFEGPTDKKGLPAGWTMWGKSRYKDPANYTPDTTNPHGGETCFRIHHPAGTAGYVISSPEKALHPRPGMMYAVTFWARADKPTVARFGLQAFRTISPYTMGGNPGHHEIEVPTEWTRFKFMYHEGWEFFADRAKHIVLDFKAAVDKDRACTLWIDDVRVVEAPSDRTGRLLDPRKMDYEKLNHRLRKGDRLAFAVDPARRIGPANRNVGGVSFHRVAGWAGLPYDKKGRYVLPESMERAIRALRLPLTRFYGVGDEEFPLSESIDKAAAMCKRIGVDPAAVPLEFEVQGATRALPPETWAAGVKHSLARGHGFRYWEITNEPYVPHEPMAFPTADDYAEHVVAVGKAIRAVHPEGRIGMSVKMRSIPWGQALIARLAGHYDWIAPHYYCFIDAYDSDFEDVVLTGNYHVMDLLLQTRHVLAVHNPGRKVVQYDTEWGLHSRGPDGEKAGLAFRNGNVYGTLHRAVRLIYYARENLLAAASSWEMFSTDSTPGMGFFSKASPEKRHMLYWLYYYFNRHVGDRALAMDGEAPYHTGTYKHVERTGPLTPAMVTADDDGRTLYVVAANGSWGRDVPARIDLGGFPAAEAAGVRLGHDGRDAHPRSARKADFVTDLPVRLDGGALTFDLPAHSVVFITVKARP